MGIIDAKKVGKEIKIRRIRKNITQSELAKMLDISQTHLSNVENGRVMLSLEGLCRIKRYLNCTLDELIDPEEKTVNMIKTRPVKRYRLVSYDD